MIGKLKQLQSGPLAYKRIEKRILGVILIYACVLLMGMTGYHFLEGWSWLESLYMTVITITTVGFGEVRPLDIQGQVFTIALVLLGVGCFTYTFGIIADYLVAGQLNEFLFHRRMKTMIRSMKEHYIVCGLGRVGFQVAEELRRAQQPVAIIEENEKTARKAMEAGYATIEGNANSDQVLESAGIERAKGLIATLGTDSANLMVVLSGRALNKNLFIVARANYDATEKKLLIAGANRVISPYSIGGRRIAQTVLRPHVVDFLDTVMHHEDLELIMEDLVIGQGSKLDGSTIGTAKIREATGVNILGLRREEGKVIVSPTPDTTLQAQDVLVVLGTRDQLSRLENLVQ